MEKLSSLGVVGCGKMGQALVKRLVTGLSCRVVCCDVSEEAREQMRQVAPGVELTDSIEPIVQSCDVVIVAVKPVHAPRVLESLSGGGRKLIVSIVAGLRHAQLSQLSGGQRCVRVMPNTPAMVGEGAMVILDSGLSDEERRVLEGLLGRAGTCHYVPREEWMDAVTGLSGSGPALFAMIVEAASDAGVAEGLPRGLAQELARETMLGTAKMLAEVHPAVLKENVMSPGGTTAAGVLAAEQVGLRRAVQNFVAAASEKSRRMG
ncbi:MAG: pyrroline-5-carboxylate reductase [Bradymonadia bacterium]